MRQVYMDHAATTPVATDVLNAMIPYFTESFGNPSSLYTVGQKNKEAITAAREKVAKVLNASPDEIYFTSGGTESDNWALKGTAFTYRSKGNHIITTKIEHHAILHSAEYLAKLGYDVTYLDVDSEGRVSVEDVEKAITDKTILVSIMFANNEIGTIQPIAEIGKLCHKKGILFHTDAVQAVAHVPIDVKAMNVDMLSLSAHKFYGPKGTGVMYIRKGVKLDNYIHGGGQERGRRATTENVAGIVGLGAAIERANLKMEEERRRLSELRNNLIAEIMNRIPYAKLNGALGENRLPNNVNVSLIGVEGETLIMDLDMFGISASTGSACSSGSLDPSHVLMAIGLSHEQAHGSLRLSLGESTTKEDIDYVVEKLVGIVERRRNMSPLWEDFIKAQERSN
ncbi:MAG: cysteine desulfurase NifS [Aminobacterium sp.]|jgi:cysteine desulfurase|uniref:cysteine desulfurase NifS n=1 Tax=Aminobacterium sp. TaxID=1872491 RepID=UPI001BCE1292|nr:cysteine desulfurase NifS [Aminobacterium sp.]MDD2207232.1 cysteine desulfurase NifS [Aminobacterium sp.]MDD3426035.1 cysteine desulfurase NifS [Aminobacterium sp.]MDD3707224.1 cysteine desulfurase NifS [Aminobacterium sp.]MDD4229074.1 cysteine desulfurase NifS [Aminobacterium sp.]MDD4551934.1 cysteine desulfurase NifS [Aminobacterium sp.]